MTRKELPPEDHVMRLVAPSRLRKDENNVVVGVSHTAFRRRDDEDGLSVTWIEYFAGVRAVQEVAAVHAFRASNVTPGKNSAFAIGNVGGICAACNARPYTVRIVHSPTTDNLAHAEVVELPRDDDELLEALAAPTWSRLIFNADVPQGAEPAPPQAAGN
jgi:hypothetical protein